MGAARIPGPQSGRMQIDDNTSARACMPTPLPTGKPLAETASSTQGGTQQGGTTLRVDSPRRKQGARRS